MSVRIGIHTGPVVIGEIGGGGRHEHLALGETPNLAARVQGLADPNSIVISAVTRHLVMGLFECQELGPQELKGFSTPVSVYRVVRESAAQNRFEAEVHKGLTPLVGRELEVGLLRERWERVKAGAGQVVLLNGEPGIGKSRLVQVLKEQIVQEGATRLELPCSSYHQHSAYHPILDHLQRILGFTAQDSSQTKLDKLTQMLSRYRFPQLDTLPLLAAFLSLPHPEQAPPLSMSPQKQKEKTQAAVVAWLVEEAEKAPVYCVWEDVHWADPSTLEVLTLLLAQVPATRLLVLVTFRPEFTPSWGVRSYLSQLTLSRLDRSAVETMVMQVNAGKSLPPEVLQQIVMKTDGVPLFVEELTKMVLESGLAAKAQSAPAAPILGIPTTLQDALMARLDRLAPVREIAQMGAVLGREFSYELLQAIAQLDEERLQQGLGQLVETELVYQRGAPPQATYTFKHALIQDTAYQSLLKSRRQQLHQQIAQILAERFPAAQETQPELLAHHYTEAGLVVQAIPYWQKAGQRAAQRSANVEAIAHLTKGLELLRIMPDSSERAQQELSLQLALGPALMATKSIGHSDVESAYSRARVLCQQIGDTPQLFPVLWGLRRFYSFRADYKTAQELEAQLLHLAQNAQDPALLLEACVARGLTSFWIGQQASARECFERGMALYDPQSHHAHAFLYGSDPGVACHSYTALTLWYLGYPDRALQEHQRTLALARELTHPFSLVYAFSTSAWGHHLCREVKAAQDQVDAAIRLATEQGFPFWVAWGSILRGWALTLQGEGEKGIAQLKQGITAHRAMGAELGVTWFLAMLAEAYAARGQVEDGLHVLTEALDMVDKKGERAYEAELYRLKGELLLAQARKLRD
ncbi:MAG: AAA family ATPase [Deltaproteobacteria bacterium]|nr:AAA family ATPase [Deltaproteobacteria bacterium]